MAGWVARLVYSDANNDGIITVNTEILQETHYYPFGLEFQGHYIQQSGFDYRYKYNGIERLKDLDVGIDMAYYRGMDPTTGRWMQVDPKAEIDYFGSPYRHAFNNPISFNDSDGDTPVHAVAAVIGAGINLFNNWDKVVKNPWSAIGYAATGAIAGAATLSPGGAVAAAKITAVGNFATDAVSGNIPDINSVEDAFGYVVNSAMNALDVAGAGKLAKAGLKGLGKLGIDWASEAVHATGEWVISDVTSEIVGSSIGGTAFGTVVTDYKMEWVVRVGMGPIGFGSAGKALGVASPNGGTAPQHGGTAHNDRIDKWVQKAQSTKGVDNIRKNQQQIDINGNRVGTNRPDLQYDYNGKHYNLEWDNSTRASARHRRVVTRNDPKAFSKFWKLFK